MRISIIGLLILKFDAGAMFFIAPIIFFTICSVLCVNDIRNCWNDFMGKCIHDELDSAKSTKRCIKPWGIF